VTFSQVLSAFRRHEVPLGAAAILAVAFVSFRVSQSVVPATVGSAEVASVVVVASLPSSIGGMEVASVQIAPEKAVPAAGAAPAEDRDSAFAAADDQSSATALAPFIPLLGGGQEERPAATSTFGLRYVESSLISSASVEPSMARTFLNSSSRLEVQVLHPRPAVEPLHQITPPSERRGTRILTAMVSMASVENAMRTTERAASRLSEEQLYDQIHRFGARGAGVNVKF
jgi:hypothetical protein